MIMAMITQAFRYAYEPFVFGKSKDKDSKQTYAVAMKYFVIFTLFAFLIVMFYIDLLKIVIIRDPDYWIGLRVVPIVMAAEIMMGIYFNLSFWYKLIDKTIWGAWFSGTGCLILIVINILFIPKFSYMACAWAGFAGYATAMLLSYFVGQKKFPIHYDLIGIGKYVLLAAVLYGISCFLPNWGLAAKLGINTVLLFIFVAYLIKKDFPLSQMPVIGHYFNKK
jgi:O-antigen/teichoic acid export membrane protein